MKTRFNALRATLVAGCAIVSHPAFAEVATTDTAAVAGDGANRADGADIVVTGQKPISEASAGTKTDTSLLETPQSISVVSSADIANLGLQNLNQALRFVAGVTPETRGASAEVYDQFKLRGFDAPIYLDGLKLFASATGYASPQVDVSRLDRIEIVKGPASALYGQSGPGGLVVEESKMPLNRDLYGAVAGTYGSFDIYRVDADVGGRFSDTAIWRVYGSVNGQHSQQEYGTRRRQNVSGAITLGADTRTSFTVLAAYSHDPRNGNYGVFPALGTLVTNPAGRISQNFYGGEPDDYFKREQFGLTYIFRHDFGGGWAFRTLGRYQYVHSRLGIVYTGGTQADFYSGAPTLAPTIYSRFSYSTNEQVNSWTYDNQLTGSIDTGPLHHKLLFGADRQVAHSDEDYAFGGATTIDVFDPVYGTMPTPRTPAEVPGYSGGLAGVSNLNTRQRQQGVYAQDQISIAGLRVTLSGRQDWARQTDGTSVQNDSKFTYRVGGLYLLPFGLAPYVSYSTSFQPQAAQLQDGTLAKPSIGKQIEGGLKYKIPGTEILLTGAYFNIKQTNVLTYTPLFVALQSGKVRSRGVEVEATAPLPYGFNAKVAFSRQSVKVLEDANPDRVGRGLVTVGRGGVSANLEWSPRSGPLEGLVLGGAVRHVDRVYADLYTDPQTMTARPLNSPSYTLFDALARYDLGKLNGRLNNFQVAVNAMNVFNKRYLTSCFANYGWCWYGNRRTVQGTISYKF